MGKRLSYIFSLCALLSLMWGCQRFDEQEALLDSESSTSGNVELLDDGRMQVTLSLSPMGMADVAVASRAATVDENSIEDGWCLIFGEAYDKIGTGEYSDESPLLLREPLTVNANGTFMVSVPKYEATAFLRIVVNLTYREEEALDAAVCWGDNKNNYYTDDQGMTCLAVPTESTDFEGLGTFLNYRYHSVGLDAIYDINYNVNYAVTADGERQYDVDENDEPISYKYDSVNTTAPDPSNDTSPAITMSSVGFVFDQGIDESSLETMFGTVVYMVRVCSKVDVKVTDSHFLLKEIYLLGGAQESLVRSSVLTTSYEPGDIVEYDFDVPVNLGDTISYKPLVGEVTPGGTSSPIYFFPNSGGDYDSNEGAVDRDVNPQYIIIKGRSGGYDSENATNGYDTDGYYKIALKARYPLKYEYDFTNNTLATDSEGNFIVEEYSGLTYDILRNTHFTIDLTNVDKPGYKTYADAADSNNPASNISYSITILNGSDNARNEVLVSNGTYYVELATTRVYMKGYGDEGSSGSIEFSVYPNDATDDEGNSLGYYHPAIYVMSDFYVDVESCDVDGSTVTYQDLTNSSYADDADDMVRDYWYYVAASDTKTTVTVNFSATESGRLRLRIGDMLKFIPLYYEATPFDSEEQTVKIVYYENFGYDKIKYLTTSTTASIFDSEDTTSSASDFEWFTSTGMIAENSTTASREIRALIYPTSDDGITKLYFKQDPPVIIENFDSDAKTEGESKVLDDGNVIYLGGISYEDANGDTVTVEYEDEEEIAEAILSMLDKYTTIYFEDSADNFDIDEIMALVVEALQDEGVDPDDMPFSVSIELVDDIYQDFGKDDQNGGSYFEDNLYITTVILPSSIKKIYENAFINCPNLTTVIVGSPDNPCSEMDEVSNGAFEDCDNLVTLIVYSKATVSLKSKSGTGLSSTNTTAKVSIVNGSGTMYLWGDYPADYDYTYYTAGL